MAELFEEVVALLESRSATRALAGRFRIDSQQAAGAGAVLYVPIFLAELSNWANDPVKFSAVMKKLRTTDTRGLNDPGAAVEGSSYEPVGTAMVDMLFGDRRRGIAGSISAEAGIGGLSAERLLPPAAWVTMACLADRFGNRMDQRTLARILNREVDAIIDSGWGPWLDATGQKLGPDEPDYDDVYGESVYGESGYGESDYGNDGYGPDGYHGDDGYGHDEYDDGVNGNLGYEVGPGAEARSGLLQDAAGVSVTGDHYRYGLDPSMGNIHLGEPGEVWDDDLGHGQLARRAMSGAATTGQLGRLRDPSVRRLVEQLPDDPSPSKIPLLLAVVAAVLIAILGVTQFMGGDDDGSTTAADVDLSADPSVDEAAVTEPTGEADPLQPTNAGDVDVGGAPPVAFDPRGDGAFLRLASGRLVLVGSVADQATIDGLFNEYVNFARPALEVASELTVAEGSPLPSGRITLDSGSLFDVGSDQLSAQRGSIIDDLAAILVARPTWTVTIIGHTDATGSEGLNLDLSQRRADAVRDELVAIGVPIGVLRTDGVGSSQPVADNSTVEGQAMNRRIEVIVDRG